MGILNVTPDSFYDGGRFKDEKSILTQAEKLLKEGATFIDIGAYSSRPGADFVSQDEELKRLIPIINSVVKTFPGSFISIDSFRSHVIKTSVEAGATMVNDISGGQLDPLMFEVVGALGVPYIMMHMRGTPGLFLFDAIDKWNSEGYDAYISLFFSVLAVAMFFFRKKFKKRFKDRGKL